MFDGVFGQLIDFSDKLRYKIDVIRKYEMWFTAPQGFTVLGDAVSQLTRSGGCIIYLFMGKGLATR